MISSDGEAKFWLEPVVALAASEGYNKLQLRKLHKLVEKNSESFRKAWKKYFGV